MDLVIQASAISAADVAAIASLTGAHGIHALGSGTPEAFRLVRAQPHPGVAALCAAAGILRQYRHRIGKRGHVLTPRWWPRHCAVHSVPARPPEGH